MTSRAVTSTWTPLKFLFRTHVTATFTSTDAIRCTFQLNIVRQHQQATSDVMNLVAGRRIVPNM